MRCDAGGGQSGGGLGERGITRCSRSARGGQRLVVVAGAGLTRDGRRGRARGRGRVSSSAIRGLLWLLCLRSDWSAAVGWRGRGRRAPAEQAKEAWNRAASTGARGRPARHRLGFRLYTRSIRMQRRGRSRVLCNSNSQFTTGKPRNNNVLYSPAHEGLQHI